MVQLAEGIAHRADVFLAPAVATHANLIHITRFGGVSLCDHERRNVEANSAHGANQAEFTDRGEVMEADHAADDGFAANSYVPS